MTRGTAPANRGYMRIHAAQKTESSLHSHMEKSGMDIGKNFFSFSSWILTVLIIGAAGIMAGKPGVAEYLKNFVDAARAADSDREGGEKMGAFSSKLEKDRETGWNYVLLSYAGTGDSERASIKVSPEKGNNLFSFQVGSHEYLFPLRTSGGAAEILGSPVLYPTPNRVRNAQFTFGGRTFAFKPNDGEHFIHGLVRNAAWSFDEPMITEKSASLTSRISIKPGTEMYDYFPVKNTLEMTYTLGVKSVRIDFLVKNDDSAQLFPFGLAIHPFFSIIGPRESVRLQVPAMKRMEALKLLPTGRLIEMGEGAPDLRQFVPLSELDLDDVYWGMKSDKPAVIYYDTIRKKVTLKASAFFTHCVVYTPPKAGYFCIENQSCSTDAHNLYAKGFDEAANLTILKPGESLSAWVEMTVSDL